MRAAIFNEPRSVTAGDRPDPSIVEPSDGVGVDATLECVGTGQAMETAIEKINPGRVLDYETDLEGIGDAYAAMDERRAIKSMVRVGSV
jgi:hypothetical protein